jgi:hypothetical protein
MGKMLFGKDETVTCIQKVPVTGSHGEALCLAHKTTKYFFVAGVYVRDDGYVLGVEADPTTYYPLGPERTAELQESGMLPRPLPPYSVSWFDYAFGYSLWIILAGLVVAWRVKKTFVDRRLAEDAVTPTSFGPPALLTSADRFVAQQVTPLLVAGEAVQHQAYALAGTPDDARTALVPANYAVLTDRRLFLFKVRVGAFGPLLENLGCDAIERQRITGVAVDDRAIEVRLDDGTARLLWVHRTKKLSNQRAFLRDVPRLLTGRTEIAAAS